MRPRLFLPATGCRERWQAGAVHDRRTRLRHGLNFCETCAAGKQSPAAARASNFVSFERFPMQAVEIGPGLAHWPGNRRRAAGARCHWPHEPGRPDRHRIQRRGSAYRGDRHGVRRRVSPPLRTSTPGISTVRTLSQSGHVVGRTHAAGIRQEPSQAAASRPMPQPASSAATWRRRVSPSNVVPALPASGRCCAVTKPDCPNPDVLIRGRLRT